jgi:hypothetical protein
MKDLALQYVNSAILEQILLQAGVNKTVILVLLLLV